MCPALRLALGTHVVAGKAGMPLSSRSFLSGCHIRPLCSPEFPRLFLHIPFSAPSLSASLRWNGCLWFSHPQGPAHWPPPPCSPPSWPEVTSPHFGSHGPLSHLLIPVWGQPCSSSPRDSELPQGQGPHLASARSLVPGAAGHTAGTHWHTCFCVLPPPLPGSLHPPELVQIPCFCCCHLFPRRDRGI